MTRLDDLRAMRDFIDREIADELERQGTADVKTTRVMQQVADLYEVTVPEVLGSGHRYPVARARQGIAWLLKRNGMSGVAIARVLGYSDRSTICYSIQKIDRDGATRALLLGLEAS